jgi:hypothetical protein
MVNGMQDEAAAVEMAEVMAEVRGRLSLRARFEANREAGRRMVWQESNQKARNESARSHWAECCGMPTSKPVFECGVCRAQRRAEERRASQRLDAVC